MIITHNLGNAETLYFNFSLFFLSHCHSLAIFGTFKILNRVSTAMKKKILQIADA